jgi:putative component of toxin-antitoxin plasmid stabilization module
MQTGEVVYLLLVGGDKSSQQGDIEKAQQMAAEIREEANDD